MKSITYQKDRLQIPPLPIPPIDPISTAAGGAATLLLREGWSYTKKTGEKVRKRRNEQYDDVLDSLGTLNDNLMESEGDLNLIWGELSEKEKNRLHDSIDSQLRELDNRISDFNSITDRLSKDFYYELNDENVRELFPNPILADDVESPSIHVSYDVTKPAGSPVNCQRWLFYFGPLLLDVEDENEFRNCVDEYAERHNLSEYLACSDWDKRCHNQEWWSQLYTDAGHSGKIWRTLREHADEFEKRLKICNEIKEDCIEIRKDIYIRQRTLAGEYYQLAKRKFGRDL